MDEARVLVDDDGRTARRRGESYDSEEEGILSTNERGGINACTAEPPLLLPPGSLTVERNVRARRHITTLVVIMVIAKDFVDRSY